MKAHFEAIKALLLLACPSPSKTLRQRSDAPGNTRQLRAFSDTFSVDSFTDAHATDVNGQPVRELLAHAYSTFLKKVAPRVRQNRGGHRAAAHAGDVSGDRSDRLGGARR